MFLPDTSNGNAADTYGWSAQLSIYHAWPLAGGNAGWVARQALEEHATLPYMVMWKHATPPACQL